LELKTLSLRKEQAILSRSKDAGRVRKADQDKGAGPNSLTGDKKRIGNHRPKELWLKRKSRQ
jgi:hypothetical protein